MNKLAAYLWTLIGILWILPLLGVSALDNVTDWVVSICVIIIGVMGITAK